MSSSEGYAEPKGSRAQCTHFLCLLQNVEEQLSDEWVLILPDKEVKRARGPVCKARLGFFLDEDAVTLTVLVHHVTHGIAEARRVADYLEDWKAESIKSASGSRLACMTLLWHQGSLHSLGLSCLADL